MKWVEFTSGGANISVNAERIAYVKATKGVVAKATCRIYFSVDESVVVEGEFSAVLDKLAR